MLFAAMSFFVGCTQSATIVDQTDWPLPMAELLAKYPEIVSTITTYKHDAFVNAKFAWRIVGQADEIKRLIDESKLKLCTTAHVKFKELKQSIPDGWSLPHTKDTLVYAPTATVSGTRRELI
jgi:hypothetical protein